MGEAEPCNALVCMPRCSGSGIADGLEAHVRVRRRAKDKDRARARGSMHQHQRPKAPAPAAGQGHECHACPGCPELRQHSNSGPTGPNLAGLCAAGCWFCRCLQFLIDQALGRETSPVKEVLLKEWCKQYAAAQVGCTLSGAMRVRWLITGTWCCTLLVPCDCGYMGRLRERCVEAQVRAHGTSCLMDRHNSASSVEMGLCVCAFEHVALPGFKASVADPDAMAGVHVALNPCGMVCQ